MDTYDFIRQAVIDRCCLTATYEHRIRHFSPHSIGRDDDGERHVMAFQYGGQSSKPLPPLGQWRCFAVQKLQNVLRNTDDWRTGPGHSRPNKCVTHVDVQAR
jgi:hypothetical protein